MLDKNTKIKCSFCEQLIFPHNKDRHESNCYLNPLNLRECLVCHIPIKDWKHSKGTCSHGCSNTAFRSGENHGNWNNDRYQSTCFAYHEKKCVVCGEENIVAVHHLDHDKKNNDPENLIPMCPTHHQYWHSKFKPLVEQQVIDYITEWKTNYGHDEETGILARL